VRRVPTRMNLRSAVVLVPLLLVGCGSGTAAVDATDPPQGDVAADARTEVRCEGKVHDHGAGSYDDGLATVQGSATEAVDAPFFGFREPFLRVGVAMYVRG